MKYEQAKPVFDKLVPIFLNRGVHWWIDFGTLLSAIRDKQFIPWDGDIDISIKAEDWDPALLQDLSEAGFTIRGNPVWEKEWMLKYVGEHRKGAPIKVPLRFGDTKIGLHIYTKGVGQYSQFRYFTIYDYKLFQMPDSLLQNFEITLFYEWFVGMPSPAADYLTYVYGTEWQTPIKNYTKGDYYKRTSKIWTIHEN